VDILKIPHLILLKIHHLFLNKTKIILEWEEINHILEWEEINLILEWEVSHTQE
jgi:hypothetical protein